MPTREKKSLHRIPPSPSEVSEKTRFHLWSIWLFTLTDLKTILGPCTAFALINRFGHSAFQFDSRDEFQALRVKRLIMACVWVYINLLPFTIDNQRQEDSIEEDACNKPWRVLPSGRMTRQQAKFVMIVFYIVANATSLQLGAPLQSLALVALGTWYNDLGGADISWLVRNFINGLGFICFASGAFQVTVQQPVLDNPIFRTWLGVIFCVVSSTVQTQDMYDQFGDSKRDRKTAPLVLGDWQARQVNAMSILLWSWFCPMFWSLPLNGYLVATALGTTISYRTLIKRSVEEDKTTFKLWNLWLVGIYALPLLKTLVG